MRLIPFPFMNSANSSDVNCGPLSETSCSCNPKCEKIDRRVSIVCCAVVDNIMKTSGHFEWASSMMKNIFQGMAQRSLHGFASRVHPAISRDAKVQQLEQLVKLDMLNKTLRGLQQLYPGHSTKSSFGKLLSFR